MTALPVAIKQQYILESYNNYTAECLRMLTENTAKYLGGKYIEFSFEDTISPKPQASAEEIVNTIKSKFRG
jgi:hypothetical protein